MAEGVRLINEGRYRQAEEALTVAWREARRFPPGDPRVAVTHHRLGFLFGHLGRSEDAEQHYKRALRLWESAGPDWFREMAESLNDLAALYLERNQVDRAEQMCRKLSGYAPERLGDDLYSHLELNLALIHYKRGEPEQAGQRLRTVLSVLEKRSGRCNPEVGTVLNNLGVLASTNNRTAEAKSYFQRALGIRELHDPLHPDVVPLLRNLAVVDVLEGNLSSAEALYRRALRILEIANGPDSLRAAPVLDDLAIVLAKMKRGGEAKQCRQRARTIRANHPETDPDRHIVALDALLKRRQRSK
jgi:tetratricopeptide (TPR) repeat protein